MLLLKPKIKTAISCFYFDILDSFFFEGSFNVDISELLDGL